MIDNRIAEVLISAAELEVGIKKGADFINQKYAHTNKPPLLVGILKGCIPFIGKLLPWITIDVELDFLAVTSYHGGTESSYNVQIITDLVTDVTDRDVILIEDIVDTAYTISKVTEIIKNRGARSLAIVSLLDKPGQRLKNLTPDFTCFTIPSVFVVGFGLDYKQLFRNLPYIGVLKPEVYSD